ncbi:hypothetical protein [Nocardia sp. NRRL S-836]|nr:hypothetical protein [Nocardia sp. NRRL S-836]
MIILFTTRFTLSPDQWSTHPARLHNEQRLTLLSRMRPELPPRSGSVRW